MIKFKPNGKLKILQVSDAQDLHIVRRSMIRMLNAAYDYLKPDLVLLTGDNVLGNHINDSVIGTRQVVKTREKSLMRLEKAIDYVVAPIEERHIPFAVLFGNHDDMNEFSKEEQAEIYMRYSCCLGFGDGSSPDRDTYNIPIYDSKGEKIVSNIFMMCSCGHTNGGKDGFEYVPKESVEWYINKSDELQKLSGGKIKSLMFQHIPFPQILRLVKESDDKDPKAIRANGKKYVLDTKYARGTLGEYPCVCEEDFGQFDVIKKRRDISAVCFGHDHMNSFTGRIDGVNIVQTSCASFRCYGNDQRGVRLFELDENNPSDFKTSNVTYYDIFKKTPLSVLKYNFDADEKRPFRIAVLGGAAATMAATISAVKYFNGIRRDSLD